MPVDPTALVILIVALLPGAVGEWIYRSRIGIANWRDTSLNVTFRILAFSLAGATLYVFLGSLFGLPPPNHLFPSELSTFGAANYMSFFIPLAGHVVGTVLVGFTFVFMFRFSARFARSSGYPTTWDEFVSVRAEGRWVAVSLKSGVAYVGKLVTAEHQVQAGERDITLEEPALWSQEDYNYTALNYQYIYLPAAIIDSIAAYSKPDDKRTTQPGKKIFEEQPNER